MIPRNLLTTAIILVALAAGMSLYLWQLRRAQTTQTFEAPRSSLHVASPGGGSSQAAKLFVADDTRARLRVQTLQLKLSSNPQSRALQVLDALVDLYQQKDSPHTVAAFAEIRGVYLVDPGLAVIDVNTAFADGQPSGILAEELTVASLVQTVSANVPNVTKVKFLVDGKERETLAGHVDLTGFLNVAEVSQVANQLLTQ